MKIVAITPAFNEEEYITYTISSMTEQTITPDLWIIVDDGSTDSTYELAKEAAREHDWIEVTRRKKKKEHVAGSGVVSAFYHAFENIDEQEYDIICKFDADLEFPENYLEKVLRQFKKNPELGICGGVCSVYKNGRWIKEKNNKNDHIRGALKSWRVNCFGDIGGIHLGVGWDTFDELLARYYDWEIRVLDDLAVKHHKPTFVKSKQDRVNKKFGEAYYKMGYGPLVSLFSSLKHGNMNPASKNFWQTYIHYIKNAIGKTKPWTSKSQARFIRKYRYRSMLKR